MTQIATANSLSPVADITLLADNPADMVSAQANLVLWCEQKALVCEAERNEAAGNAGRAKASGWSGEEKRWMRVAGRARLKAQFYEKVKAALLAGYYIVPPFPGQVFAIRTKRNHMVGGTKYGHWNDHEQREQTLPVGEGEYKNPFPAVYKHTDTRTLPDGTKKEMRWTEARDFEPMEFPIALAKPEILDATSRAMALKVFDRLSVLPRFRAPDPIVMGEINMPHKPNERVAFFVAWWIDTKSL